MTGEQMAELRSGWRELLICTLGLAVGNSALLFYTMGVFAAPLNADIGLTRTQFGLGTLLATIGVALTMPFVGAAIDRRGVRLVVLISASALAIGFAAMGLIVTSVVGFLLLQTLIAAISAGTGPISFTRVVSRTFTRMRGLALGIALTGIGASAAVTPALVALAMTHGGWRSGYLVLAATASLGLGLALLLPRHATAAAPNGNEPAALVPIGSMVRSKAFIVLIAAFSLQSFSFGGMMPHFVPLLIDSGVPAVRAAAFAGGIGIAVVVSRLLAGWLTDRLFAPLIGAAACLICAAGLALLLVDARTLGPIAALALGCTVGAEVDLIGYCTARYFGLRAYGRIYGLLYAAFLTSSGLGPVLVGMMRDSTGSYSWSVMVSVAGLCLAACMFLFAPRYPESDQSNRATSGST